MNDDDFDDSDFDDDAQLLLQIMADDEEIEVARCCRLETSADQGIMVQPGRDGAPNDRDARRRGSQSSAFQG